eukprot:141851-Pleurochrysis_carterae.AAC.3
MQARLSTTSYFNAVVRCTFSPAMQVRHGGSFFVKVLVYVGVRGCKRRRDCERECEGEESYLPHEDHSTVARAVRGATGLRADLIVSEAAVAWP